MIAFLHQRRHTFHFTAVRFRAAHFVGSVRAIRVRVASEALRNAMPGSAAKLTLSAGAIGFVTQVPAIILAVTGTVQ